MCAMPQIEYVTLANHVEAVNGLLYMLGAGWTDIRPPIVGDQMGIVHFGIGVSVLVGWNETNQRYPVILTITGEDGGEPLVRVEGQIEQGRPPGTPPGSDMRSVIGLSANVQFPNAGGYTVRVELLDQIRTVAFRVVDQRPAKPTGPASY
jgi:hypothetical protein